MAIRVYNAAEVAADLFGRTLGTTELEILLGDNAAWDTQATLWMYDPTSTALDNWTGSALTSTVIKPTSITHPAPGRWLKKQNVANASGTTAQYIRGDGSLAAFPAVGPIVYNNAAGTVTTRSNPKIVTLSGTVSSAGNVIFYLTDNGAAGGNALFTNVDYVNPIVNDSSVNYSYGWTLSGDKKTLTVNTKAAVGINVALLSLTLLGVPSNVANGTAVTCVVVGN